MSLAIMIAGKVVAKVAKEADVDKALVKLYRALLGRTLSIKKIR